MKCKKLFGGLVSLVAATLAVCAITVSAGAEESGDYKYKVLADGTAEITGYSGDETDVEIPSTLDDLKVTSIGNYCFSNNSHITSVTIPDGVTSLGTRAFSYCTSLAEVDMPDSLTHIGRYSFYFCRSLSPIIIPENVTSIEYGAFYGCSSITEIDIPDGVTEISRYLFEECSNLASITIPDGVTLIDNAAFRNCASLAEVNIPDSVTSLGDSVFKNCTSLTEVTIPDGVTTIKENTFYDCSCLSEVTIPESVTTIGEDAFGWCVSLDTFTIPASVTSLGDYAFESCLELNEITIPESLTDIGEGIFYGCTGLNSVTLPDTMTSIGVGAFSECSSLSSITLPKSLTSIGDNAFEMCSGFTSIIIPEGVTSIGDFAFAQCANLSEITMPDSLTSIGAFAFGKCDSLTSLALGNGVTGIGPSAFTQCENLTSITIPDSVETICSAAFWDCSNLNDVYFIGSKEQWDEINIIKVHNDCLLNANIHYNCVSPISGLYVKGRAGDALRIAWEENSDVDGYIIEMPDGDTWTRVGKITKNATVEFRKAGLKAGTEYSFRVKTYKKIGTTVLYSEYVSISAHTNPSVVSGLKVKGRAGDALRIAWEENTSADGYIIEIKDGDTWTRVGKITKNTTVEFRKAGLMGGTKYSFRVKSYKMSGKTALYSAYKTISATTNPSVVSGLKLKAANSNAVRLAWEENASADGYIIEQKINGEWTRVGKVTKNTTVEFRKAGLNSKTSYSFRVKAYKTVGKTSLYSAVKTITVKTK